MNFEDDEWLFLSLWIFHNLLNSCFLLELDFDFSLKVNTLLFSLVELLLQSLKTEWFEIVNSIVFLWFESGKA